MKKGITFVAVMVTVAIMLILVSTVTISAINITNNSKKTKLATELAYIEEAINNYYISNGSYPLDESVPIDFKNFSDKEKEQFKIKEEVYEELLYKINKEKLGISETIYGNNLETNDIYAFSKKLNKVYYLKGVKIGSTTYYTLTPELKKIINYEDTSVNGKNSDKDTTKTKGPEITLGEKKSLISYDGIEKHYYIPVNVKAEDNEIKIVKFEREVFSTEDEAKIYFKTNGIELQENIIEIEENTKGITVYAEDSAGNINIEIYAIGEPVIPNGFVASQASGESDVNTGLVIYEGDEPVTDANVEVARTTRNQFVWIPVNNISDFKREDGYSDGEIQNYLKITSEPYKGTDANSSEEVEYNAMYESVKKHHGFYIARYEASKNSNGKAQSLKNVIPWKSIIWANSMSDLTGGAVEAARDLYPVSASSSGSAVSTLIYGVEWDQVIKWISKTGDQNKNIAKDSTGKGSYSDVSYYKSANTGSNEAYKQNNIYDMCSNLAEWTMEADETWSRITRGGDYTRTGSGSPISYREGGLPTNTWDGIGFRIALYIK